MKAGHRIWLQGMQHLVAQGPCLAQTDLQATLKLQLFCLQVTFKHDRQQLEKGSSYRKYTCLLLNVKLTSKRWMPILSRCISDIDLCASRSLKLPKIPFEH